MVSDLEEFGGNILESREYGSVHLKTYATYFELGGWLTFAAFVGLSATFHGLKIASEFLLMSWSLQTEEGANFAPFMGLTLALLLLSFTANRVGQKAGAEAREKLHQGLMRGLFDDQEIRSPSSWIARMSADLRVVDLKIPSCLQRFVLVSFICVAAVVVVSTQGPEFLAFAVPLAATYWFLQRFYCCSSRELQRLETASRTPIVGHFKEVLDGAATIRAFKEQPVFRKRLAEAVDLNSLAFLTYQSSCRWLGFNLDVIGVVAVVSSLVLNLVTSSTSSKREAASIGWALNSSLLIPIYLSWVVKFFSDLENHMNSVSRILEYSSSLPKVGHKTYFLVCQKSRSTLPTN